MNLSATFVSGNQNDECVRIESAKLLPCCFCRIDDLDILLEQEEQWKRRSNNQKNRTKLLELFIPVVSHTANPRSHAKGLINL